jgi:predicted adenine nucleotide alpha hydrolase (AANH) superfamily ATPase
LKFKIYLINSNIHQERAESKRKTKIKKIISNLEEKRSKRQYQIEEEGEIELGEAQPEKKMRREDNKR